MLSRLVPAPLVRLFARPYVAGYSMEAALTSAAELLEAPRLLSTLDLLGEHVTEREQVDANLATYERLIDALGERARFPDRAARPTVSVKPSAFTTGDQRAAFELIRGLAERARAREVGLTIDMEDHPWTDMTIERAVALFHDGFDVGTVLQSRLNRYREDAAAIPAGMRVRLVIGIYREPAEIATTDKREMKARLLEMAATLLDAGAFVEFATHDEAIVERFARELAPRAAERCEVQMLLGVPRGAIQERLLQGAFGVPLPVRLYVPFGIRKADATAYLRRRMDENPRMALDVLRNLARRR
ncbi:MAG: proline dehydrogenase family protein [Myxococcales bacterium]|nr:proline dehydrogenase family protein [Myxococcales bacterium]